MPSGRAEKPLWWLLGASVVLPLLVLAVGSIISYHQNFVDAHDRLERTLGTVTEHATKVFETFEITAVYVDQLIGDVSNDEIRLAEMRYHERLKRLTTTLPQLRDVFVIDLEGHPIVSGTIYPMNYTLDLSDREFYRFLKDNEKADSYLSNVIRSRAAERNLFLIARRRLFRGEKVPFRGVVTTAIAPEYFSDYYARLPAAQDYTVGLVRPMAPSWRGTRRCRKTITRLPANGPLVTAMQAGTSEFVTDVSPADNTERIFAFRRLPREGVYRAGGRLQVSHRDAVGRDDWLSPHLRISGNARTDRAVLVCLGADAGANPSLTRNCARKRRCARAPSMRCARRRRWRRSAG